MPKKRTRQQAGQMARRKGARTERKIAKLIAKALDLPASEVRRTPSSGALIERSDLRFSEKAQQRWPFFVEVKAHQGWTMWQALNGKEAPQTVDRWPPHKWFHEAIGKSREEVDAGFSKQQLPVLLVLLQNRRPSLVMFVPAELPPNFVTALMEKAGLSVAPFFLYRLDWFLETWQKFLRASDALTARSVPMD